jgi:hypothetical protein
MEPIRLGIIGAGPIVEKKHLPALAEVAEISVLSACRRSMERLVPLADRFRIAGRHAKEELRLLWRREMVLGAYSPRWAKVDTGEETVRAIAFFVNRQHSNYAGRLPLESVIKTLVSTRGQLGTPAEYLMETGRGLTAHGVRDAYLLELRKRVLAIHPELGG